MLPSVLQFCAKLLLTMAFTFTSLPLNFYNSVSRYGCGFGFEQKYWWINGFGEKKARIGGPLDYTHIILESKGR